MNTAIVISVPSKFIKTENKCQRSVLENGLLTNLKALRRIDRKHRCDSSELKDVAVGFDEKQKFYRFTEKEMRSNRRSKFYISRRFVFLICIFRRFVKALCFHLDAIQIVLVEVGN